jgi:hypothetical protein
VLPATSRRSPAGHDVPSLTARRTASTIRNRAVRNTTTLLLVGLLVAIVAATAYQLLTATNL